MQVDRPVAGLLTDLKARGMLDETLVVFATEFGRTPGSQGADGRDHHPHGFSIWIADSGLKGGGLSTERPTRSVSTRSRMGTT
jgi:uncharacterized protein (DUF1501 family)